MSGPTEVRNKGAKLFDALRHVLVRGLYAPKKKLYYLVPLLILTDILNEEIGFVWAIAKVEDVGIESGEIPL